MKRVAVGLLACMLGGIAVAQKQAPPPNSAPPRSEDSSQESSSKDTQIDLSPPAGDAKQHPNSGVADDVLEMHPYDPHKAMKSVEVGDYYFKRKNYVAAESRYREALSYKPNDAIATYRLADVLEKEGKTDDARLQYESYLKILPNGPEAEAAKKALERLPKPKEPGPQKAENSPASVPGQNSANSPQ